MDTERRCRGSGGATHILCSHTATAQKGPIYTPRSTDELLTTPALRMHPCTHYDTHRFVYEFILLLYCCVLIARVQRIYFGLIPCTVKLVENKSLE